MNAFSPPDATLRCVDFADDATAADFLSLLDHYAQDPMGGGSGLSAYARTHLVERLRSRPGFVALIAYQEDRPIGLINCMEGFSTFAAKPLLNVHDLVVHDDFRGRGIGQLLLQGAEALARERGCCKLTLEVLEGNHGAMSVYRRAGFRPYELDPRMGRALFLEKKLG